MRLSHRFRNSQILPLKCILQQHLSSSREKLILRSYLNSGLNLNNKCWKGWGGSTGTIFFHGQNYIKSINKHNLLYVNHVHLPAPSFVLWKHVPLAWSKLSVFLKTLLLCGFIFIPAKIVHICNKINLKMSPETRPEKGWDEHNLPITSGCAKLPLFMCFLLCHSISVTGIEKQIHQGFSHCSSCCWSIDSSPWGWDWGEQQSREGLLQRIPQRWEGLKTTGVWSSGLTSDFLISWGRTLCN